MEVYQKIIDDIRTILSSDVAPAPEALEELVDRYTQAIQEVNERLRESDALLQKGHRTEAIQKCETEPSLLGAVALLEFAERDQWMELVRQYGLPSPLKLLIEVAADLNEAYAQEAPLAKLMRQHRLHALARSPLAVRIDLLRTISSRDPGNPLWQEDLQDYEKMRHSHMPSEVSKAVERKDFRALTALEKEVTSDHWILQPDQALVNRIVAAHTELRVAHARSELEDLVQQLSEAHSNFDVELGRSLRKRWKACAVIGIEHDNDLLLERAGPALEWLEEQDRAEREESQYNNAIADLEQALDESARREDLEALYHAVIRFDCGIPDILENRVSERIQYLEVASRRRSRMVFASIVLILLAVTGGMSWLIIQQMKASNLASHVTQIENFLKEENLPGAKKYIEELEKVSPELANSPDVKRLVGELEAANRKEENRRDARYRHLASARSLGLEKAAWETFKPAQEEVEKAKELSVGDAELAECASLKLEIAEKKREMQKQENETFVEKYKALYKRFDILDYSNPAELDKFIEDGNVLLKAPGYVSYELKDQIKPLLARAEAKKQGYMAAKGEADFLKSIDNVLENRSSFESLLKEYAKKYPNSLRSREFLTVCEKETELWDGLDRWNAFLDVWYERNFSNWSPADAEKFITEAETLIEEHPGFPPEKNLKKVIEFLQPLLQRVDENGEKVHLFLFDVLNQEKYNALKMVMHQSGKRYYFGKKKKEPPVVAGYLSVYYYIDVALEETEREKILPSQVIKEQKKSDGSFDWTTPQDRFGKNAIKLLNGLKDFNWEKTFYEILKDLAAERNMEPCLRLVLLREILYVACQGSQPFNNAFGDQVEQLDIAVDRLAPEQANWVNPNDEEGGRVREEAASILSQLKFTESNLLMLAEKMSAEVNLMKQPTLGQRYHWIGWLKRDKQGKWVCPTIASQKQKSSDLLVLYNAQGKGPRFVKIGNMKSGKVTLKNSSGTALVEGRPVYSVVTE